MVKKTEVELVIAAIEKRRLKIEEKRSLFQFEMAFFIPIFALLFLVTHFSQDESIKLFFYIVIVLLIVADLVYSILIYKDIVQKQQRLEQVIHEKIGAEL